MIVDILTLDYLQNIDRVVNSKNLEKVGGSRILAFIVVLGGSRILVSLSYLVDPGSLLYLTMTLRFIYFIFLICVNLQIHAADLATKTTALELKSSQALINNDTSPFCYGTGHSRVKQSFFKKEYKSYLGNNLALVYPFCLTTHELGNRLGNYFNELACAGVLLNYVLKIVNIIPK